LYTDKTTIAALIEEYNSYLKMCRPLMHIYTPNNKTGYLKTFSEFENELADCMIKSDYLSSITMPYELLANLASRIDSSDKNKVLNYQKNRVDVFESNLKEKSFTEIITLPDAATVKSGCLKTGYFDIFSESEIFYTPEEFISHIQNIIRLLRSYDNYNIYINTEKSAHGFMLYVKDNIGVLVAKTTYPSVIFAINESNLTAAFWDYLSVLSNKFVNTKKSEIINTLNRMLSDIYIH